MTPEEQAVTMQAIAILRKLARGPLSFDRFSYDEWETIRQHMSRNWVYGDDDTVLLTDEGALLSWVIQAMDANAERMATGVTGEVAMLKGKIHQLSIAAALVPEEPAEKGDYLCWDSTGDPDEEDADSFTAHSPGEAAKLASEDWWQIEWGPVERLVHVRSPDGSVRQYKTLTDVVATVQRSES